MGFWLHYVIPPGAAGADLAVPDTEEVLVHHQDIEVEGAVRTVEFSVFAEAGGLRIVVDVDATALLRREPEAVAATAALDEWILRHASHAVRVHELVIYRWFDVCTESFRTSGKALTGWLTSLDPNGDYWQSLGA
ncbi:hypothetical protein [Actinoplanes couchii]|uniref:Uncharacterized protein n=1 Tax=Actinoplanes couchii TaxID=403638 RepID=A0ABQ3XF90_9ACTN|nr:hypothetical protein [Actinoplanes couchii]MDR6321891.1 hypothetical protein [Actinoplanes couchii]GID57151.1 hypothetical protein Aco03nite_055550 [Actinoplanes couchii]